VNEDRLQPAAISWPCQQCKQDIRAQRTHTMPDGYWSAL